MCPILFIFFSFLFHSVGFRMCISCWELLLWKTNTGKERWVSADPKRIEFFIYFSLYSYIKCRYLSGSKKKHTKAPVSLRFTTLEENNFMKDVQSNLNPGPLQSPRYLIEFLFLSARVHPALLWRPLRNIAATLSTRCPADALEVSMATRMASRDCEGQSEPINGTMLRDKKKKTQ